MTEKTENQIKKEEKLKEKRTFPVGYTVLLVVIVLAQIGLVFLGIAYQPKPQDVIRQYNVFVEPRKTAPWILHIASGGRRWMNRKR